MNLDIFGDRGQRTRRFLWSSVGTLVFGAISIGTGVVAVAVASGGYENSRGQEVTPIAAICPAVMCVFFGFFVLVCAMLAISSVRGAARLDGNTLIVRAAGKYSQFALNEAHAEIARGPIRKGLRLQNSVDGPPLLIVRAPDGRPARLALSPEGTPLPAPQLLALAEALAWDRQPEGETASAIAFLRDMAASER